jgi:hypothetical protein
VRQFTAPTIRCIPDDRRRRLIPSACCTPFLWYPLAKARADRNVERYNLARPRDRPLSASSRRSAMRIRLC